MASPVPSTRLSDTQKSCVKPRYAGDNAFLPRSYSDDGRKKLLPAGRSRNIYWQQRFFTTSLYVTAAHFPQPVAAGLSSVSTPAANPARSGNLVDRLLSPAGTSDRRSVNHAVHNVPSRTSCQEFLAPSDSTGRPLPSKCFSLDHNLAGRYGHTNISLRPAPWSPIFPLQRLRLLGRRWEFSLRRPLVSEVSRTCPQYRHHRVALTLRLLSALVIPAADSLRLLRERKPRNRFLSQRVPYRWKALSPRL